MSRVRSWATVCASRQTGSADEWADAAHAMLAAGASIEQIEAIPETTWRVLVNAHGSRPYEAARSIMVTLNVLGLPLEAR